jgi:hypothetical protein
MPEDLGEVCTAACPGSIATMTIVVSNEDFRPRSFTAAASGPAGSFVELAPEKFEVGPKERHTVTARMTLPATSQDGLRLEAVLWIRGCRDHFVRWTVRVGDRQRGACRCIDVVDRPDYIHHWYDHFYCVSGCRGAPPA